MTVSTNVSKFLLDRQALLTPRFESGDVDKILEFYDPDLSFSDHAWHATNLNYTEFEQFLKSTYDTSTSLRMETHGVHGASKDFSAWEWTLHVIAGEDDPIRGLVKGKEIVLRGCSLHWWKLKDGGDDGNLLDWRIVKEADYACGGENEKTGH
ncbi:hypothetical protein K491DRAFT_782465 [Lophiostoma macrostomum CBS 122681]|uniref:SnoaL-like domain-containing protein n=1 Tax=Lophiostoma macrostomum CBS 122681 TaxID=1314788 RepID=A0A6A6SS94_9PLEO|nr:hypothetical protein K491DRAFT_782465 [Lophiostoma macrostomum CBS 122681]